MPIVFDPSKSGLEKVLKDYQIEALKTVWGRAEDGATSSDVYVHVNETLKSQGKTISRASIINFLNAMCDEGVLKYKEETGKGGYRRRYFPNLNEDEFKKFIAKEIFTSLLRDFPEQTVSAFLESIEERPDLREKVRNL